MARGAKPVPGIVGWTLVVQEGQQAAVVGGRGTLKGRIGDTVHVVPVAEVRRAREKIRDELLDPDGGCVIAAVVKLDAIIRSEIGPSLAGAEEILREVAKELGFEVPPVKAVAGDPMSTVLSAARQEGAWVRFKRVGEDDWTERAGDMFVRYYKQLMGLGQGAEVIVDRVWVPEKME